MKFMNMKLVLSCGAFAVFGATSLQGCSSSDDTTTSSGGKGGGAAGTASGGKGGSAGTASGGKGGSGHAGTGTAGEGGAGAAAAGEGGAAGASEQAGAAGSDAGAAGAGPVTQADLCTQFCADEATTCASSALMQYASPGECMTDCLGYPLGTPEMTSGNTLYCRIYHLGAAAGSAAGAATTHCPHTGPNPSAFCIN